MRDDIFLHAVNQIASFLGSKEAPPHTTSAWYEKVANIPDEAVPYIVSKITDEADAMPRNLPKAFRECFRAWQMEHPEKFAVTEETGCADCEKGVLFLERRDERGHLQSATIFCQCYTGNAGYVGRSTLVYMQRKGWRSTKADKLGPQQHIDTSAVRSQMARAMYDEQHPDWQRYDGYEETYA